MSNVLIQIGFPKTGSTYLQEWFRVHPAIYYKGKSVAGFYDSWEIEQYVQQAENDHQYYTIKLSAIGLRGNVHKMIHADFTENSIDKYQHDLSKTLYKLFPAGKIMIVTRGFASMLSSLYTEYIVSGGTAPFDLFYDQYKNGILKAYNYDSLVRTFQARFGRENVIVMPYELLRDEPENYTRLIEQKLGITPSFSFSAERINASPDKKYLRANQRVSNLVYKFIKPFPRAWQGKMYGFYARLLNKKKNHLLIRRLSSYVKTEIEVNLAAEKLKPFEGKAEIFREEPLYQTYLEDYLIR